MSTPSPEQLRLAADIQEKRLDYEVRLGEKDPWHGPGERRNVFFYLRNEYEFRLRPWTLPEPPKGRQWHRTDGWTKEMLPDGWRPLLNGEVEQKGDEYFCVGGWGLTPCVGNTIHRRSFHGRTKRPLPPLPAEPEWIPLEAADIPPGSAFRNPKWHATKWVAPDAVHTDGIDIPAIGLLERRLCWSELFASYEISIDGGKTWEPAKKLKVS